MRLPEPGSYRVDAKRSKATVYTYKVANLMSKVAHDLELHTTEVSCSAEITAESAEVRGLVTLWNLSVKDGILSRLEKGECERVLRKKILVDKGRAVAKFDGKAALEGDALALQGSLSLVGSRPRLVNLPCSLELIDDGFVARLRAELLQTDYGITPYKAMMGMLKLQDRIEVALELHFVEA